MYMMYVGATIYFPANTIIWPNAGLLLGRGGRRPTKIKPTVCQRLVLAAKNRQAFTNIDTNVCYRGLYFSKTFHKKITELLFCMVLINVKS